MLSRTFAQYLSGTLLAGILLLTPTLPTNAADEKLMITREVILPSSPPGIALDPHVITRADDGGFLVAGATGGRQKGWAIRTDGRGNVLWRYTMDLHNELPPADSPTFDGAVVMPDGSSYLCGFMPAPRGKYQPALLTHLDAAGHVLSEKLLAPQNSAEHGLANLNNAIRLNDGVAFLGQIISFSAGKEVYFYWLLVLDARGQTRWEKLIPTSFDKLRDIGPLLATANSGLIFSGLGDGTEIFRVSASGELEAQAKLSDEFLIFSRPEGANETLQMYGNSTTGPSRSVELDDKLRVIGRTQATEKIGFDPYLAYRRPDHSLVLFGTGGPADKWQRILLLDPTLQQKGSIEFPPEKYADFMALKAATPTGQEGEYVTARLLQMRVPGTSGISTRFDPVGAALDFIQVQ